MRIAMIGPFGFHPKKTMRARAFRLARALVQRGHSVHMFMPPWHTPDKANTNWSEEGVYVRYVALGGGHAAITRRLINESLAVNPDVVHCFKPKAYSGLAAWWLWYFHRQHVRLVVDTDDWEGWGGWNEIEDYSPLQKQFFAWQEKWGMRHCHALTVASRALQTIAWAHRVQQGRVVYLPNGPGIDQPANMQRTQEIRQELGLTGRPVLLLYSRLFEFDTRRLVNILARLHSVLPDLAVLSVGAGLFEDDAVHLRNQLEAANLMNVIVDVGWRPEPELPSLLAAADAGLYLIDDTLLNRTKCPVKLADMLYSGLPVVGENVGQVPEYVLHRHTGFLRDYGDEEGIARDLAELLSDRQLREGMGQAALRHVGDHFAWQHRAADLEWVYGGGPQN